MFDNNARVGDSMILSWERTKIVLVARVIPLFLCQPTKFLGHCRHPHFFEIQIIHELGVLCDGLIGHRVDNTAAYLFNINNVVNMIKGLVEGLWDCRHRGCVECTVDDMV
jgi:hypothetical protein